MQSNEQEFNEALDKVFRDKSPDYSAHINIALVGKVSSGKSSLLNAFFERDRGDLIAEVGATSGVTTVITPHKLDEHVLIIDCPGLGDIREENNEKTEEFLESIDLGIFVVTGSADSSQKANFEDLKKNSGEVFVVINKIDEWDELEESEFQSVMEQWRNCLGVKRVFGTCTKGYDPKTRKDRPMDTRGVDELRDAVFSFLKSNKKDLLLAKHLKNKNKYAAAIIGTALAAVAAESFIPGSAIYITATQAVAICSLHYLYTGQVLDKTSALGILPTFIAQSAGKSLFLWSKSILPPTGVVDAAAAVVAVIITFATLAAIAWILGEGKSLTDTAALKEGYAKFAKIGEKLKEMTIDDFSNKDQIIKTVLRLLS